MSTSAMEDVPPLSVLLVLGAGSLFGGVVKGVTGFGSAIINLLVWITLTSLGVNGGTLTQAVVAECLAGITAAIPLLILTKAHRTADWRLVLTIAAFVTAGAPLGALLLEHSNPRLVELVMACGLVLMVGMQELPGRIARRLRNRRARARGLLDGGDTRADQQAAPAPKLSPTRAAPGPFAAKPRAARDADCPVVICLDAGAVLGASDGATTAPSNNDTEPLLASSSEASTCSASSDSAAAGPTTAEAPACSANVVPDPEGVPLQQPKGDGSSSSGGGGSGGGGSKDSGGGGFRWRLRQRLRAWASKQDWAENRRIVLLGSVAGFCGGVMGGMTGIGGPPLMYLYDKLATPKDVVRGTNSVTQALQVRVLSYIAMGVLKREDALLYTATSVLGLVGVGAGCAMAGRLSQATFGRVLTALMCICCVLLFASAAGLKGHAA